MDKLKEKIKIHLKLLAETNMYTKEMEITATDLYNLFTAYAQQVSRKVAHEAWIQSLRKYHNPLAESGFTKWIEDYFNHQNQ